MRRLLAACAVSLVASLATPARADDDVAALEKQLADEHAALSTSDCTAACRALASIRRAADKICALEPGTPRCTSARAKADDAMRRVRDACPDCAIALGPPAPSPEAPAATRVAEAETRKTGGCAGCAATPRDGAADAGWLLVALAGCASRLARRRR